MKRLLLAAVLTGVSSPVFASTYDGNAMYEWAQTYENKGSNAFDSGMYVGYIVGLAEITSSVLFCPPPHTQQGQLFDIVYIYLRDNPAKRSNSAGEVTITALRNAYPCSNKK